MKQWLWISVAVVSLVVFSRQGTLRQPNLKPEETSTRTAESVTRSVCLGREMALLPKLIKARSSVSGAPILLKVSQPKYSGPESCTTETSELGWQTLHYAFPSKAPIKISVYTSALGSLLWKSERSFTVDLVRLVKKQSDKEIYQLVIHDPNTQIRYDFELNLDTSRVKLRILP